MSTPTDAVWDLLERIPPATRLEDDGIDRLTDELAQEPVARMVECHLGVVELSNRALGWDLWEASDIIGRGELSLDGYQDFRLWLIMLGREAYETALADPDSLAEHPAVQALAADPTAGPPGCLDLVGVDGRAGPRRRPDRRAAGLPGSRRRRRERLRPDGGGARSGGGRGDLASGASA